MPPAACAAATETNCRSPLLSLGPHPMLQVGHHRRPYVGRAAQPGQSNGPNRPTRRSNRRTARRQHRPTAVVGSAGPRLLVRPAGCAPHGLLLARSAWQCHRHSHAGRPVQLGLSNRPTWTVQPPNLDRSWPRRATLRASQFDSICGQSLAGLMQHECCTHVFHASCANNCASLRDSARPTRPTRPARRARPTLHRRHLRAAPAGPRQ